MKCPIALVEVVGVYGGECMMGIGRDGFVVCGGVGREREGVAVAELGLLAVGLGLGLGLGFGMVRGSVEAVLELVLALVLIRLRTGVVI